MKHKTFKTLFWLVAALALLYTVFFTYGVTLVGFRLMLPWASPVGALVSMALALLTMANAAECRAMAAEMAKAA